MERTGQAMKLYEILHPIGVFGGVKNITSGIFERVSEKPLWARSWKRFGLKHGCDFRERRVSAAPIGRRTGFP